MGARSIAALALVLGLFSEPLQAASAGDAWQVEMRRAAEAHQTGDLETATERLEAALALAEGFGSDDPRLGETLLALGAVRYDRSDYAAALEVLERCVAVFEQAAGPDSVELAGALNALGLVYSRQGRPDQAAARYRRALAINEKALGREHPRVAHVLRT